MGNIANERSDFVKFVLQLEDSETLTLGQEPIGWDTGEVELVRNKKYHGIYTSFSGDLKFDRDAKDFIISAFKNGGINTNLYLIRYDKGEDDSYSVLDAEPNGGKNIKWVEKYRGLADFKTKKEKEGVLSIRFNSDELEQLVKSYESDSFDLERTRDVDGNSFDENTGEYSIQKVKLTPRTIIAKGEHVNLNNSGVIKGRVRQNSLENMVSPQTQFISKGFARHVEVSSLGVDYDSSLLVQSNFCYNDIERLDNELGATVTFDWDLDFIFNGSLNEGDLDDEFFLTIQRYEFIRESNQYERTTSYLMGQVPISTLNNVVPVKLKRSNIRFINVKKTTAFAIFIRTTQDINPQGFNKELTWAYNINNSGVVTRPDGSIALGGYSGKWEVSIREDSFYEGQVGGHKFSFINEIGSRLMQIITGDKQKFYSKLFGRKITNLPPPSSGKPPEYQDYTYEETGQWGNIAAIHGLSVRGFKLATNPLYKGLEMSLKDLITSLQSTFNIGVGIEKSPFGGQRLRFEKLEHFYRDDVSIKLPIQISKVERMVDVNLFFSSVEFGCDKGGDYDDESVGLDEPNVKTSFTTPLKKTETKYTKTSKIRSDDYGREIIRRKPEWIAKEESSSGDEDKWYLNIKWDGSKYVQRSVFDDLVRLPEGVLSPLDYQSWAFTPKRSLLRHGWVIRTGMDDFINSNKDSTKVLNINKAKGNDNLKTEYDNILTPNLPKEERGVVVEKGSVRVYDLQRPKFLPEIIKFTHPITEDIENLIHGTTKVFIGGEFEEVPNYYFKFQWINENEEIEFGYLKSFKAKSNVFEFILSNEKIIY